MLFRSLGIERGEALGDVLEPLAGGVVFGVLPQIAHRRRLAHLFGQRMLLAQERLVFGLEPYEAYFGEVRFTHHRDSEMDTPNSESGQDYFVQRFRGDLCGVGAGVGVVALARGAGSIGGGPHDSATGAGDGVSFFAAGAGAEPAIAQLS